MPNATRHDPRYVSSDDPSAVLRAWVGSWDMGGWTDTDEAAFREAVLDELRHAAGPGHDGELVDPEIVPATSR